jgi:hypothetical protein
MLGNKTCISAICFHRERAQDPRLSNRPFALASSYSLCEIGRSKKKQRFNSSLGSNRKRHSSCNRWRKARFDKITRPSRLVSGTIRLVRGDSTGALVIGVGRHRGMLGKVGVLGGDIVGISRGVGVGVTGCRVARLLREAVAIGRVGDGLELCVESVVVGGREWVGSFLFVGGREA